MKSENIRTLKIEFEGKEAETVKAIVEKIHNEATSCGFNNFTTEEITLIKDLKEKLEK